MVVIEKHRVAEWMLLSYLSQQRKMYDRITFYEKKYGKSFSQFNKHIQESKNEDFEEWDDLIEWEAYTNFYKQITNTINDIKSGNFEVA